MNEFVTKFLSKYKLDDTWCEVLEKDTKQVYFSDETLLKNWSIWDYSYKQEDFTRYFAADEPTVLTFIKDGQIAKHITITPRDAYTLLIGGGAFRGVDKTKIKIGGIRYINSRTKQYYKKAYYYDINNAYGWALQECVDKQWLKDRIRWLVQIAQIKPIYKNLVKTIFVYCVGCLANANPQLRAKIVTLVNDRLQKILNDHPDDVLEINTDGVILKCDISHELDIGPSLGQFKAEILTDYLQEGHNKIYYNQTKQKYELKLQGVRLDAGVRADYLKRYKKEIIAWENPKKPREIILEPLVLAPRVRVAPLKTQKRAQMRLEDLFAEEASDSANTT